MPTLLKFKAIDVKKLVDHAFACKLHGPTGVQRLDMYGPVAQEEQPGELTRTPPGLLLVRAGGIYLLSNGTPPLMLEDGEHQYVVYAEGYDPAFGEEVVHRSRAAVGGDDFLEFLGGDWCKEIRDDHH